MTRTEVLALMDKNTPVEVYARVFSPDWATGLAQNVPAHMLHAVVAWVVLGECYDDFLEAVIEGDLFKACAMADDVNRHALFRYAVFFHNHAPSPSFKRDAIKTWKGMATDA
jgi:hypothetical protein